MTADTAIRASLTVPGLPDQVHAARMFVDKTLGGSRPCTPIAVLLVSELVTNSVLHSESGRSGGTVTITVTTVAEAVRVEVRDAGGPTVPLPANADSELAEHGRGLRLVNDLAARWDYRRDEDGLVTWFEVTGESQHDGMSSKL